MHCVKKAFLIHTKKWRKKCLITHLPTFNPGFIDLSLSNYLTEANEGESDVEVNEVGKNVCQQRHE